MRSLLTSDDAVRSGRSSCSASRTADHESSASIASRPARSRVAATNVLTGNHSSTAASASPISTDARAEFPSCRMDKNRPTLIAVQSNAKTSTPVGTLPSNTPVIARMPPASQTTLRGIDVAKSSAHGLKLRAAHRLQPCSELGRGLSRRYSREFISQVLLNRQTRSRCLLAEPLANGIIEIFQIQVHFLVIPIW